MFLELYVWGIFYSEALQIRKTGAKNALLINYNIPPPKDIQIV